MISLNKGITGLPPAYQPLIPLFERASLLAQNRKAIIRAHERCVHKPAPANISFRRIDEELPKLQKKLSAAFSAIHEVQGAEGNFEIFEAQGLLETIGYLKLEPVVFYGPSPKEALVRLWGDGNFDFARTGPVSFFSLFEPILNSQTIEALSMQVQKNLALKDGVHSHVNEEWGVSKLFGLPNASLETLSTLSLSIVSQLSYRTAGNILYSVWAQNPSEGKLAKFELGFAAAPRFVEKLNPHFFLAQLHQRGVDAEVSAMLLPSWKGDFDSFLTAASTLSAEE